MSNISSSGISYFHISHGTFKSIVAAIDAANIASEKYSSLLKNYAIGVGDEPTIKAALVELKNAVEIYRTSIIGLDMETFPLGFMNRIKFNTLI